MLFFTRACLCIGAIVVLAEGFGPADLVGESREAAGTLAHSAATRIEALCRSEPADCLAVATAAMGAAAPGHGTDASVSAPRREAGKGARPALRRDNGRGGDLSLRPAVPK